METRKIKLEFPLEKVSVPVFSQLATTYDVQPNVLAADIAPSHGGWLTLNISGDSDRLEAALEWIKVQGISAV
jgi:ABC-type methionine transport system ATPase subunit